MNQTNSFLNTLQHLRYYEEILLFSNLVDVAESEERAAIQYLAKECSEESINYPFSAPPFDPSAALWGARTLYRASQLLLYREHKHSDLPYLFPEFEGDLNPGAVLSADLFLRFLPDVLRQLEFIDPEDVLIQILEGHLRKWHYSGVRHALPVDILKFEVVTSSPCLFQLYVDRVFLHKNLILAKHPALTEKVRASLGMYAGEFWEEFNQATIIEHEAN